MTHKMSVSRKFFRLLRISFILCRSRTDVTREGTEELNKDSIVYEL